ncbi:MAG: AAA family ATPase [Planctomycetaceae bacterium]|nr:AAA family ATPase [Planctomycetaceae bacterium]
MSTFERIHIQGFRRLVDVNLPLKPLNVLIGANGCGKTSLLDVFSLLGASAQGELESHLYGMSGFFTNVSKVSSDAKIDSISFILDGHSKESRPPFRYAIELVNDFIEHRIASEELTTRCNNDEVLEIYIRRTGSDTSLFTLSEDGKSSLTKSNTAFLSTETALFQAPTLHVGTYTEEKSRLAAELATSTVWRLRNALSGRVHYHNLDVGRRAPVRTPQSLTLASRPGADAQGLASCLYGMRENQPDDFEAVQAALRAGFPNFERLGFPAVAAGLLAMTWKDKTSKEPFYMHQLSEGTLRFLWLVTLLYSPGLPALTMIDEPEVSLHPELLAILAELFREASQRTQLIVATHSDRLVRHLKPDEVVAMNMLDTGAVEMVRGSELDLDEWLKDYSMDELWSMGILGGRAQ